MFLPFAGVISILVKGTFVVSPGTGGSVVGTAVAVGGTLVGVAVGTGGSVGSGVIALGAALKKPLSSSSLTRLGSEKSSGFLPLIPASSMISFMPSVLG